VGVFSEISALGHEQIVFCQDDSVGLKAIIAVHDTTLGPALGGCRMWNYENEADALTDVLRLSRGMTYKAAVAGLNLGGGKAVIIGDPKKVKSPELFKSFGRFVDSLGGRYITAEDVNITVQDIEHAGTQTKFVSGVSTGSGDPSPITALGVYHGLRAAVKYRLGKDSLKGIRVAVQGVGAVGSHLCKLLHGDGAKLFVCDIEPERIKKMESNFGATAISEKELYGYDVDVYAPCALGATLNDETIPQLKATIVAGGANNQLKDEHKHGALIKKRGILYTPDYVINAGGIINVYREISGATEKEARDQAANIYNTCLEVFKIAEKENIETQVASARIAEKRLAAGK
jgi:leucine dehydrogenase